ncbi:acetyl/propionyl/methylcrotonyl-CoA carboxylase subunit alpha [Microbispora oryzae]|uniref:acetyl/propionyl/methylcrotonyl-CoA carboxylase subunit alpha n=1 Tax=Microbispora oryzae TaxID=2806554 RepID=UPI001E44AF1C|nr:biotin carboxylase N-terminal domain-containing protein [Microbispora oryzae]
MIERLLVANRGEIARRVFRTCRELGIGTVAVFSDADAAAPHTAEADLAVRLGAPAAYLDPALVVDAARRSGADAVHPGYGFLSENAEFARAVLEAGLTWIGPSPDAIAAMGSKIEAKAIMTEAGVPVLPTFRLSPDEPADLPEPRTPLLVKASAGGGGRGMRVVRDLAELPQAIESARREALSAFGDGTLFAEPLLEGARHVEVQILADAHGTVWALGERECSIQRRHQKVIEEAPSPGVTPELRRELFETAVRAASAIGYVGAGTVEFLLAPDGAFHFLEMNTRLQVEHPVTEAVYGVDLVRLQIEVAEGVRLPALPPSPVGHAIEARLYAEDADGRPQAGVVHRFEVPGVDGEFALGARLRLDSGIASGDEMSVHYDPMLGKVIAYAETRAQAARRLAAALAGARVHGPATNRDLLVRVLRHPEFRSGALDTRFLDRDPCSAPLADPRAVRLSALAAALAGAAAAREAAPVLGGLPSGWRNVPSQPQRAAFRTAGDDRLEIAYRFTRDGLRAERFDDVRLMSATPELVTLDVAGVRHGFAVAAYPGVVHVDSSLGPVRLVPLERLPEPGEQAAPGSLLAPMPGTVLRVEVAAGDEVVAGQPVLVLEAMKMEHRILSDAAGSVSAVSVTPGSRVDAGTVLAVITPRAADGTAGAAAPSAVSSPGPAPAPSPAPAPAPSTGPSAAPSGGPAPEPSAAPVPAPPAVPSAVPSASAEPGPPPARDDDPLSGPERAPGPETGPAPESGEDR